MYFHSFALLPPPPTINELHSGRSTSTSQKSRENDDERVRTEEGWTSQKWFANNCPGTVHVCSMFYAMGTPPEEYYHRFIRETTHGYWMPRFWCSDGGGGGWIADWMTDTTGIAKWTHPGECSVSERRKSAALLLPLRSEGCDVRMEKAPWWGH